MISEFWKRMAAIYLYMAYEGMSRSIRHKAMGIVSHDRLLNEEIRK